jgi:hypothetical protein
MNSNLKSAFTYWRQRNSKAARALELARVDLGEGKERYPSRVYGWNRRDENGIAWVENLEHAGLRFVNHADEIVRLNHKGWYADSFQDSLYRGCVLQLPGRDGRARYLAAYADPDNESAYRVDASGFFIGDARVSSWDDDSGAREAARAADSLAEREAESAREYNDAFHRGVQWSFCGDTIHDARRELAALRREVRAAKSLPGVHTAKALVARCAQLRDESRKAHERRAELANGYYDASTRAAFNEGAGKSVV